MPGEANSTASGGRLDNQVFVTFRSRAAGYSISYPEGWTQKGTPTDLTFADKSAIVHIVITAAGPPSPRAMTAELDALRRSHSSLTFTSPKLVQLPAGPAVKATYTVESSPNPVTGKTVLVVGERYELSKGSRRATFDLGMPKGVDNIAAYRRIANSFRWL